MDNKKTFPVVAGVAVLVAVAGGLFLSGIFDAAPTPAPKPEARPAPAPPAVARESRPDPVTIPSLEPVPTVPFTAADDQGTTTAFLAGQPSGLRVTGIVEDPDGRPVPGTLVTLIRDISVIKTRVQDGDVLAQLKTGRTGGFAFDGVVPGETYILQAAHPAFTIERRHPINPQEPATLDQRIRLGVGLQVSGRVTDSGGRALEGAEVQVFDLTVQTMETSTPPEKAARSGPDGRYVVEHLQPGLKKVLARKSGFGTDGRNNQNLGEGQSQENVDFVLQGGFRITGVVLDRTDNRPIKGAVVTARPVTPLVRTPPPPAEPAGGPDSDEAGEGAERAEEIKRELAERAARGGVGGAGGAVSYPAPGVEPLFAQKAFLIENATTNEMGEFVLDGLMEARYMLQARAAGFQPLSAYSADANTDGHALALARSGRVAGVVLDDETGQPVTEFSLALSAQKETTFLSPQLRQRFSSPSGAFEYLDVRPGTWFLIAEAPGYAGGSSESLQIVGDAQVSGISIRLVRGATLRGAVRESGGKPIAGCRIDLVVAGPNAPPPNPFTMLIERSMKTSARKCAYTTPDGRWELPNVLAGTYKVKTDHPDFAEVQSDEVRAEARGEVVVPDLVVTQGARIFGVVRKADGSPDGKALIAINGVDPNPMAIAHRQVQTGPDGRYEAKGLKPGSYRIAVTQREGQVRFEDILRINQSANVVTLVDGQALEMNF